MNKHFHVAVVILVMMAWGCSAGTGAGPTLPGEGEPIAARGSNGTSCLGIWQFTVDVNSGGLEITQLRTSDLSVNVLPFMEPPPLKNLSVDFNTLDIDGPNNYIGVDVIFKHPFVTGTGVFRGFDVRGVVFGPEVTNADGFTPLLRPKDFTGEPFGYIDGILGAPHSFANYSRDENGYKYFCDGLGKDVELVDFFTVEANLDKRGSFTEGATLTRHYDLDFAAGETEFFVFNYAVLANYDWPQGEPPYEIEDFPMSTANMAEAFCFSYSIIENSLYFDGSEGGGMVSFDTEIWDWQGLDDYSVSVTVSECGEVPPVVASVPGTASKSGIFSFVDIECTPTSTVDLEVELTATDNSQTIGSSWFMGLLSPGNPLHDTPVYTKWYFSIPVGEEPPPPPYYNIIPVTGQTNLGIVISTYSSKPPKDIAVNSYDGKPKVMYTIHTSYGGHNVYRFLPDYSASDGNLVNYGHVWSARGFDTTNGWTVTGHPYQPTGHPDYGGAVNMWGNMNESGSYPIGVYWSSVHPHMEIMDAFETDDPAHDDWIWAVFDATTDAGGIRFYYHDTNELPPETGPAYAHAACFCFNQADQPGDQGIYPENVKAMDALRNSYMFTILEGDEVELWSIISGSQLGYGGLTISGFTDALDVSVDSDDYIWVLDQPDGNPRLQAFDSTTGELIALSGDITADISGDALRIDLDESDDQCHLLHTNGVSVFMIDW